MMVKTGVSGQAELIINSHPVVTISDQRLKLIVLKTYRVLLVLVQT